MDAIERLTKLRKSPDRGMIKEDLFYEMLESMQGNLIERIWFVDPNVSKSGSGHSLESPLKTIQDAITAEKNTQSQATGDGAMIACAPGSYEVGAGGDPVIDLDGVGWPMSGDKAVWKLWIKALVPDACTLVGDDTTAGPTVSIKGCWYTTIDGFRFHRAAYQAGSADIFLDESAGGVGHNFAKILNNHFYCAGSVHSQYGILSKGSHYLEVAGNYWDTRDGANAEGIHIQGGATQMGSHIHVHDNVFVGQKDAGIAVAAGLNQAGCVFERNTFHGGAMTAAIDIGAIGGGAPAEDAYLVSENMFGNYAALINAITTGVKDTDFFAVGNQYAE